MVFLKNHASDSFFSSTDPFWKTGITTLPPYNLDFVLEICSYKSLLNHPLNPLWVLPNPLTFARDNTTSTRIYDYNHKDFQNLVHVPNPNKPLKDQNNVRCSTGTMLHTDTEAYAT